MGSFFALCFLLIVVPQNIHCYPCYYSVSGDNLLEVDRSNELFDCQGCARHRWIPISRLTQDHNRNLYNFDQTNINGEPIYPCRVFLTDEVALGQFLRSTRKCVVAYHGAVRKYSSQFQVLTIPGGLTQIRKNHLAVSTYGLTNIKTDKIWDIAVPAGLRRNSTGSVVSLGYIGFRPSSQTYCRESSIGKVWLDETVPYVPGYFPVCDKHVVGGRYDILTCSTHVYF